MDDLPPRDHNQPPTPGIERALDLIRAANEGLASTPVILDEETAGRFQGFVNQLREAKADLEAELAALIEPYEAIIAEHRVPYKDPFALIELARTKIQPLLDAWLQLLKQRAEDARRAAAAKAHAAQADADRAARIAAQPGSTLEQQLAAKRAQEDANKAKRAMERLPARPQIKGEWSDKAMSLRSYWTAEITDPVLAVGHYGGHKAVVEAMQKCAAADARVYKDQSKAPPGVRFYVRERAQ